MKTLKLDNEMASEGKMWIGPKQKLSFHSAKGPFSNYNSVKQKFPIRNRVSGADFNRILIRKTSKSTLVSIFISLDEYMCKSPASSWDTNPGS
jgi:hypothetical protein